MPRYTDKIKYDPRYHREVFEDIHGLYVRWYGRVMRRQVEGAQFKKGDAVYVTSKMGPQNEVKVHPVYMGIVYQEEWLWQGETGVMETKKSPEKQYGCGTDREESIDRVKEHGVPFEDIEATAKTVAEEKMRKAKELAGKHWEWLGPLLEKVYVDAFVHGYRHGAKEAKQ